MRVRPNLIERLPCEIAYLVGKHGNEGLPAARVRLEDKGRSLSLHDRTVPDPMPASAFLRALSHALAPQPTVIGDRMVLNLLPPGAMTKFEALQVLMEHEGVDNVLFVGDDDTDEIVFERAPPHWMTVRIDPAGGSAARYCPDEQSSVEILLAHLLAEHAERAQTDARSAT